MLGDRWFLTERDPAFRGNIGERIPGTLRIQIRLGLRILGIERRRVDFGEDIALLHLCAVILVPHLHIAGDLGVDRRLKPGGNIPGESDRLAGVCRLWMDNGHRRHRVFERFRLQRGCVAFGLIKAIADVGEKEDQGRQCNDFSAQTLHHVARSFWRGIRLL